LPRELLAALVESSVRIFIAQKSLILLLLRKRVGKQLHALPGLMAVRCLPSQLQ